MLKKILIFSLICWAMVSQKMSAHQYQLAIATIFQNEGPYLKEWIEYHRMVGVQHFWLYNDNSKDDWKTEIEPYINAGIVEVFNWPSVNLAHHIGNQINAMQDALKRAKGSAKWLALIDADEYLLPMKDRTILECLDKHFNQADAVYINWRQFGTGGLHLKKNESLLFKLTACSPRNHARNGVGKSILKVDVVQPEALWTIHHCVTPHLKYFNGDGLPIPHNGRDLDLGISVHDRFIRINHYTMRDEHYFHHTRLPRSKGIGIEEWLIWKYYHELNKERNNDIILFIALKHRDKFENFWKPRL